MAMNGKRLKAMETQISNLATLMSQNGKELKESQKTKKHVAPPKDDTPTKEIIIDVTDKGKNVLTPKRVSALFPKKLKDDKKDNEFSRFL
ncbi:hypothetical protein CR513_48961, partial [Mucuna pruriens]